MEKALTWGQWGRKLRLVALLIALAGGGAAHAGKLAEGFRGLPFGDQAALDEEPMPGCTAYPETGFRWVCNTTIGEVPVVVSYAVLEGLFIGVTIRAEGYTHASTLLATLKQAYGPGSRRHDWDTDALADRNWQDGTVAATWEYNEFSKTATVSIFDLAAYAEAEKREKKRAADGVDDL